MSRCALMDMLSAQESVFTAAALRQTADQYTAAQLSAQPTSRSAPAQISHRTDTHTHTHTHTRRNVLNGQLHDNCFSRHICTRICAMCMNSHKHSECPSVIHHMTAATAHRCHKPGITCRAGWRDTLRMYSRLI